MALLAGVPAAPPARVEAAALEQADLTSLSLEELMNVEVTSAARKAQRLSDAAAAIFVVTGDDIRRSGATSIADALRLVPGLQVGRIDANRWAVSSRGFNGRFVDKLLVQIDGRTVYTPLFSGVFWDVQDTMLEDIDRIEVIRGPGASLWGANAVNGIINIITKAARDTQGGLLVGGGGTEDRALAGARYGGRVGPDLAWRAYIKANERSHFETRAGTSSGDDWEAIRGGFRTDWQLSFRDLLTLQGDLYGGDGHQPLSLPTLGPPYSQERRGGVETLGGNVLARWRHDFSSTSALEVKLYYDYTDRSETPYLREARHTGDLDLQHSFRLGSRQDIVWGLGYRVAHDEIPDRALVSFRPRGRTEHLVSAFVQDDVTLVPKVLRLTLGSKFEHNDYTGFEVQPTARVLWTPTSRQSVWAAVSRAVRTPSRADDTGHFDFTVIPPGTPDNPGPLPVLVTVNGSRHYGSEQLLASELGYRVQAADRLSLDLAAFYNVYDDLRSVERGSPQLSPDFTYVVVPSTFRNKLSGDSYGVEVAADWHPLDRWRLQLAYTYLEMEIHAPRSSSDQSGAHGVNGSSPNHQVSLRSSLDLWYGLQLDLWLRYVDALPALQIPSYVTMDARIAWQPVKGLELAVVGQNLFQDRHQEFASELFGTRTEVPRGVYGKVTWRF